MKADTLRSKFLDFFKNRKHKIVASDSLVPADDPTVLFTPAGMNQFKKEFLGSGRGLKRAATSQRCLRTDDLEKVGKTAGHHTFFEMLGNFSFGDYFKQEAISWAWEFLTRFLQMDKQRLWVSVYKDDDEAYRIWKNVIGVSPDKIVRLGDKENFWPSEAKDRGPNGPCGPCSEIFFDWGPAAGCKRPGCNPACSCGRFVEVWNLVFTQFNRKEGGILEPLPRKNIDTGMGLERLAAVMQGVYSNFETDLFKPLIKEIKSGIKDSNSLSNNELIYAVADHIRAITFAVYDGVLPSNEGRGYVVRKLIRRSLMHLSNLGIKRPFLNRLVPVVAEAMQKPYPKLKEQQEDISGVILAEEENFISILNSSDKLLEEVCKPVTDQYNKTPNIEQFPDQAVAVSAAAGRSAFQLYDTYGVPLELTKKWLNIKGVKIYDNEFSKAFDKEFNRQKALSKSQSSMKGDVFSVNQLPVKLKKTNFFGYQKYEIKAKILAILKDNSEVNKISSGDEASIVLDATVFYPEAGGQVADTGRIKKGKNIFEVIDVRRANGTILHIGKLKSGVIKKNDAVKASIDFDRRLDIARNHTATHILQAVLRKVLGTHVKQKGSLVASDYLRFDFTHFKALDRDELTRIEELVNTHVLDNVKTNTKTMPIQQAKKLGALAFFEDKYQGKVRVMSVGDYSKELCGGTHLDSAGQIGLFKILSESSIASGVRRIEAVTGRYAYKKIKEQQDLLNDISGQLKVPQQEVGRRVEKLIKELKELNKKKSGISLEQLDVKDLLKAVEDISGIKLIARLIPNVREASLRSLVDLVKKKQPQCVCLLATDKANKAILIMGVTQDLLNRDLSADNLMKEVAKVMNGSGGGREDFAFGAGDLDKIEAGFNRLREIIKNKG
ncbi:MAG: alanine--tRNA ligase [Candidatus Omnitrophota bacterium]